MIKFIFGVPLAIGLLLVFLVFYIVPACLSMGVIQYLMKGNKYFSIVLCSISNGLLLTPVHFGGAAIFPVPFVLSPLSGKVQFNDLLIPSRICIVLSVICFSSLILLKFYDRKEVTEIDTE
jgi:predicted Na+-dependent transporter